MTSITNQVKDMTRLELDTIMNNNNYIYDTKDFEDYDKAEPFRNLASEWKMNPSILAHRYALSVREVSSVILGVKNRKELLDCIEAESLGGLDQDQISAIDTALSK